MGPPRQRTCKKDRGGSRRTGQSNKQEQATNETGGPDLKTPGMRSQEPREHTKSRKLSNTRKDHKQTGRKTGRKQPQDRSASKHHHKHQNAPKKHQPCGCARQGRTAATPYSTDSAIANPGQCKYISRPRTHALSTAASDRSRHSPSFQSHITPRLSILVYTYVLYNETLHVTPCT